MDSFPQQKYSKEECILVGRVPPALVAATRCQYPVRGRVYCTPPTQDHNPPDHTPSGTIPPEGTWDQTQSDIIPSEGTWDQAGSNIIPPDRMTDTCKNITSPQLRLRAVKIPPNCNPRSSIFEHRGFNQSAPFPE